MIPPTRGQAVSMARPVTGGYRRTRAPTPEPEREGLVPTSYSAWAEYTARSRSDIFCAPRTAVEFVWTTEGRRVSRGKLKLDGCPNSALAVKAERSQRK